MDLDYCYGIGADGASVNQGEKGGFIRLFLEKLQSLLYNENENKGDVHEEKVKEMKLKGLRWIPHMWCSSHLTALGSSAGNLHCHLAQRFEEDMKNINADFTCSAPRIASLAGYQHMLAATEEKFRTITAWHECRWLSRDSSTKTLAQSLRALLLFYNNRAFGKDAAGQWIEKDGIIRAKMKGRYHQLTRYQMLRWIYFLRDILPCLTKLSKLTQRDSLTIFDLKKGIADTDRSLENLGKEIGDEERA